MLYDKLKSYTALQGDVCLRTEPGGGELHESQGYVQIFNNGRWVNICDADWSVTEATIVCRQLGLLAVTEFAASASSIGSVKCYGKEEKLDDCDHPEWSADCKKGVNVTCSTTNPGMNPVA